MRHEISGRSRAAWSRPASWLVCASLLCGLTAETAHAAGLESYRLATGYYQRKKWALAVDEFRTFLKDLPDHAKAEKAEVFLGMALVNLKEYKEAREVFRAFIAKRDDSNYLSHAMYRAGECSFLIDDQEAAENELTAFIEKFPDDPLAPRARYNLAETKLSLKKPAEAVALYQAVTAAAGDTPLSHQAKFGLAKAYAQLQKSEEAEAIYRELARDLTGDEAAEARMHLADIYFDRQKYSDAAVAYADVIDRFPESPLRADARLKLGMSLFGDRQFARAADELSQLESDELHAGEAGFWQGVSLKSAGEFAKAVAVLEANYQRLGDSPKAPRTLYQWADSEQQMGEYDKAITHFLELVRRWPDDTLADDALHAATLTSLKANQLDETETLVSRFAQEYPTSGLRLRQQLVTGRLYLAQARQAAPEQAAARFAAAENEFRSVLDQSEIDATQSRARYFLAYTAYELEKYDEALQVIAPLIERLSQNDQPADDTFVDAYVLDALCRLKLKQFDAAAKSATAYLDAAPQGEFVSQALGIRARAAAQLGNKAIAAADQEQLKTDWPQSPDFPRTTEELAEVAYANNDFAWAAELYEQLAALEKDSKYRPAGLSGLGWSHYQQKQFEPAANAFAALVKDYPDHALAPEAGFKHGASLRELGQVEEAATVFAAMFEKYTPSNMGFMAGLGAARQYRALKRNDDADKMYAALMEKYPDREDLDLLLHEWAVMHYVAEDHERSDGVWRRIVANFPDSPYADEAQLQLAISDINASRIDDARAKLRTLVADEKITPPRREEALYRLAAIADEQEQWDASADWAAMLLADYPEGKRAWAARMYLARSEYKRELFDKARPKLDELRSAREKIVTIDGTPASDSRTVGDFNWFPGVWIMLADIALHEKRHEDVAALVEEFRTTLPKSPSLYHADEVLGRSLSAQAKFDEARAAYQRVTESESGKNTETAAKSQFLLAESYFHQKNYEQAIAEYLKVDILYDFPEHQSASLYGAGLCEENLKHWQKAAETYQQLLKRFPESPFATKAKERLAAVQGKISG